MGEYEDTLIDIRKSLGLVPGFMEARALQWLSRIPCSRYGL
jgi:hypothetical protein